jgi:hypothetical protein
MCTSEALLSVNIRFASETGVWGPTEQETGVSFSTVKIRFKTQFSPPRRNPRGDQSPKKMIMNFTAVLAQLHRMNPNLNVLTVCDFTNNRSIAAGAFHVGCG